MCPRFARKLPAICPQSCLHKSLRALCFFIFTNLNMQFPGLFSLVFIFETFVFRIRARAEADRENECESTGPLLVFSLLRAQAMHNVAMILLVAASAYAPRDVTPNRKVRATRREKNRQA